MACLTRFLLALLYCKRIVMYMTQTYVTSLQLTAFYCKFLKQNDYKVQQHPINERISFLLKSFNLSARAFSEAIGEKPTITQNYVGTRNSMPSADYLEKVLKHFESIDPQWLLAGKGEPFLPNPTPSSDTHHISTKNFQGNVTRDNHGNMTQSVGHFKPKGGTDPDGPVPANMAVLSAETHDALRREIELLKSQLHDKERTIQILLSQLPKP